MPERIEDEKIDEQLLKSLSQLLSDCGASPVLWGDYLLTIYGVPSIVGGLEFVVSDERLPSAVAALKKARRLCPCPNPRVCPVSRDIDRPHIPAFHMHLGSPRSAVHVSLWPHSEILGFVPNAGIPGSIGTGTDPRRRTAPYILASDTSLLPGPRLGRGNGALSKGVGRIVVPSAQTLLEAYIRLSTRYLHESHGAFYMSMIIYVEEYIEPDGFLNTALLSEPCRVFWHGLKKCQLSLWELCDQFKVNIASRAQNVGRKPGV
ncbi:hypothetical protein F4801DRAFT_551381 [Xylaria longipes]|nr:hypothetical protein F4801DRAFT_551381 [Xylaria longipes]